MKHLGWLCRRHDKEQGGGGGGGLSASSFQYLVPLFPPLLWWWYPPLCTFSVLQNITEWSPPPWKSVETGKWFRPVNDPGRQMIPKLAGKWSPNRKWSPHQKVRNGVKSRFWIVDWIFFWIIPDEKWSPRQKVRNGLEPRRWIVDGM